MPLHHDNAIAALHRAFAELAVIPREEFERLVPFVRRSAVPKGRFFVRAGQRRTDLAFVLSGLVRCYKTNDAGDEYTKHFFKEGDFFAADSSSFLDTESHYNLEALEDLDLLVIDVVTASTVLRGHPCWMETRARAIERIHKIEERRVAALMLDDAEARYRSFQRDFPGLEGRLLQSHVASYIGISPVSLSRIRGRMRRR